jgi:hypothetical protein
MISGGFWEKSVAHASPASVDQIRTFYGPLRLVNQQPLQLLFLQLLPDMLTPIQRGHTLIHLNLALTNTLVQQQRDFTADLDLEMLRAVVDLRYGIFSDFEVGLEIPFLFTYGGVLDNFIAGVEEVVGGERALRKEQDAGEFTYRVLRGNHQFIHGRNHALGLGDIILKLKIPLLREQHWRPALGVRAAVKFPSGSAPRAFGSGKYDGAIGVLLQKAFGPWTLYLNGDVIVPGEAFSEVDLQPFFSGIAAGEYLLRHNISLVIQFRGDTRPFHDTIPILDKRLIEVLVGTNWALNPSFILQAGLAEDILDSHCCSADVSVFVNLTGRL